MQDVLTLQDQFLLQGYRIASDTRTQTVLAQVQPRKDMTRTLAKHAPLLKQELSTLATVANQGAKTTLGQTLHYRPSKLLTELLQEACRRELLHWSAANPSELEFSSTENAEYFAGRWLEEYVFLQLHGQFKSGQYALGAQIERHRNGQVTPDELDGIVIHRNRTLLVECKTKRQNEVETRDALYKLGQLRNEIGGAAGKALYVSARPIRDPDRIRARDYKIDVLDGTAITKLGEYLRNWRDGSMR